MKDETKWIIEIKNDLGNYVPYGWWKSKEKTINPYTFDSKSKAMQYALEKLPKDIGDCRIIEQDGGAE